MNLTINPGAATDDAKRIDEIVSQMAEDMQILNEAIKSTIPDGIQTTWSEKVRGDWETYYSNDIPSGMEDMKLSASNLRAAVDKALAYSQDTNITKPSEMTHNRYEMEQ